MPGQARHDAIEPRNRPVPEQLRLRSALTTKGREMLLTLAIIILILWALGFLAFHVTAWFIHILLVIGIIVLIWHFVAGRRAV